MKYDADHNGTFSMLEVENIVRDMQEAQKKARNMRNIAVGAIMISLALCGVLIGLMVVANEVGHNKLLRFSLC
jgi:hypothetical protein